MGYNPRDNEDADFDTPWGVEAFLKGEPITRITKPSQFIRLCHKITEEKQYRTIVWDIDDWPRNPVLIDLFSASMVKSVWTAARFKHKKMLVRMVRDGGAGHLVNMCFSVANAARKNAA